MKNFKDFLTEKHTKSLFHSTGLDNVESILQNGLTCAPIVFPGESRHVWDHSIENEVLRKSLKMNMGQFKKWLNDKKYKNWASFARHPNNDYTRYRFEEDFSVCILKLNTLKISKYGKIIPVDYSFTVGTQTMARRGEIEERIITARDNIPLLPAIDHAAFIVNDTTDDGEHVDSIKKRYNFPIDVYYYSLCPDIALNKYFKDLRG